MLHTTKSINNGANIKNIQMAASVCFGSENVLSILQYCEVTYFHGLGQSNNMYNTALKKTEIRL